MLNKSVFYTVLYNFLVRRLFTFAVLNFSFWYISRWYDRKMKIFKVNWIAKRIYTFLFFIFNLWFTLAKNSSLWLCLTDFELFLLNVRSYNVAARPIPDDYELNVLAKEFQGLHTAGNLITSYVTVQDIEMQKQLLNYKN